MDILFLSKRIFLGQDYDENNLINGGILVTNDGKIRKILKSTEEVNSFIYNNEAESIIDFEDKVLMPGLIDTNVHINEPGRNDWEGFTTGTKAAAAGGYTFITDMPVYSIPPTVNGENFKAKAMTARGKIYVDVGLWGGITPQNTSISYVNSLFRNGAIGLYCSLCPSQVPEFPEVNKSDIESILQHVDNAGSVLAFHAELMPATSIHPNENEPKKYETFLKTRPESMEIDAIEIITKLSQQNKNIRMHIMNLSSAISIQLIENCRKNGGNLTVETCPHYLVFSSDNISDTRTEFKCNPPIRDKLNQENLWKAIKNGNIDIISTNHSPTTPGMKKLTYGRERGDFIKAWSGIASLQFGLPIFWTECQKHGLGLKDVHRLFCENPAKLCGIDQFKGKLEIGYDADFCIWDPDEELTVTPDIIYFQNKSNPYMNMTLKGVVHNTVIRGLHVFEKYKGFGQPLGRIILRKANKQIVKFV